MTVCCISLAYYYSAFGFIPSIQLCMTICWMLWLISLLNCWIRLLLCRIKEKKCLCQKRKKKSRPYRIKFSIFLDEKLNSFLWPDAIGAITHESGNGKPRGKKLGTDWYDLHQLHLERDGTAANRCAAPDRILSDFSQKPRGMAWLLSNFCQQFA